MVYSFKQKKFQFNFHIAKNICFVLDFNDFKHYKFDL